MLQDSQIRSKRIRSAVLLLCGAGLFILAYRLRSVLNPLLLALLAAYILNPAVLFVQRLHLGRLAATSLIYGAALLVLVILIPLGS